MSETSLETDCLVVGGGAMDKALRNWLKICRLNLYRGSSELANTDPEAGALMQRFRQSVMPATAKLQQFIGNSGL